MWYLADTRGGKTANVHTDPHLVAGSEGFMSWFGDETLNQSAALEVGRWIERPARAHDAKVMWRPNAKAPYRDAHIWHCSLSLRAEEGELGDEKWGQIAHRFMSGMGFDVPDEAPLRWVAVHHGQNANGGDHIHIAVNLVRANGDVVNTWQDFRRAREVVREIQREFGLDLIEGEEARASGTGLEAGGHSQPGANRRALAATAEGRESYDQRCARMVRTAADLSTSEADFVRHLRAAGLYVEPRFAAGSEGSVVTGFSVRVRVRGDEWSPRHDGWGQSRAAGKLARDLSLPQLRGRWEDTPTTHMEAAAEWRRAKRGQAPLRDPISRPGSLRSAQRAAAQLQQINKTLAGLSPTDPRWKQVAGELAGLTGQLSRQLEPNGGPFTAATAHWNKCASWRQPVPARGSRKPALAGAAITLASIAASDPDSKLAYALIVREVIRTALAISKAYDAAGMARTAAATRDVSVARLEAALAATGAPADEQLRDLIAAGQPSASEVAFPKAPTSTRPQAPIPAKTNPASKGGADLAKQRQRGGRDGPGR